MRIFEGRGGVKRQWGCWKRQFSVFSLLISSEALEVRPKLLYIVNRGNTVLPDNYEQKLDNFHYYEQRYSKVTLYTSTQKFLP